MSMHAPSKAKKRSQSTLHRDELKEPDYFSKTTADLGLSVPLPAVLAKTRVEQKSDKVQAKKERNRRIKTALDTLASRMEEVAAHQDFVKEEALRDKQAARLLKYQRQGEHIAARAARDAEAEAQDEALRAKQAELVKSHLATLRKREKQERKMVRQHIAEVDAAAAIAPAAVHIPVNRTAEIRAIRDSLPVTAEEQPIVEAIEQSNGNAVIICGETGSGKTTQVPQFLWEAGYGHPEGAAAFREGMIGVTEPRRVAAISMAQRVAEELNEPFGSTVCYHVRYQNNLSPDCKLKFMTEGILLKEMQGDFMLRKYSAIIIDEAHERSVACDVLVGLLSRVVPLRQQLFEETRGEVKPLKLVVMSATLRVSDFRDNPRLFSHQPRLVEVAVRRFPVTCHYSRRTEMFRYVDEAFAKVCQLHKKLPPGGVLIFLATQREIDMLCKRLAAHYAKTRIAYDDTKYTKHSLIASRQERHASKLAMGNAVDPDQLDDEEEDEFGLMTGDYALDGDDDAPDENGGDGSDFKTKTGLADDFDYGDLRQAGDSDEEDNAKHAAKAKFNTAAQFAAAAPPKTATTANAAKAAVKRARPQPKKTDAPDWWPSDDDDWGDEEKPNQAAEEEDDDDEDAALEVDDRNAEDEEDGAFDTMHILPLYSLLDHKRQQLVFEAPPPGKRLIVIATNIAETSITIPNIRYVIDAGRVKNKTLQKETDAQAFKIEWISQAAAEQRSGRAGRTGPGHCYRLYSTAVYANSMPKHTDPEILRTPLESVVLMMKHLKIDHVGNFPFPTPPDAERLKAALAHLRRLGALDDRYRCTVLGNELSALPVTPRFGRIIVEAIRRFGRKAPQVVAAVLSICAVATTTMDVFALRDDAPPPNKALLHAGSDFITFLRVFNVFAADPTPRHCNELGLVHKSLTEACQLRRQIEVLIADQATGDEAGRVAASDEAVAPMLADFDTNEAIGVQAAPLADAAEASTQQRAPGQPRSGEVAEQVAQPGVVDVDVQADTLLGEAGSEGLVVPPLAKDEEVALRRLFVVGLVDQVARRASIPECKAAGFTYDDSKATKTPYWDCLRRAVVFIHPSSSIAKTFPPPEWVVYSVLQKTVHFGQSANTGAAAGNKQVKKPEPRLMMRGITIVSKQWLDDAGFKDDDVVEDIDASV